MRYYPIHLDIQNRNCLVVGGGGVGTRKVHNLLTCGARVTVVSPEISSKLRDLSKTESLTLRCRSYRSTDLEGMFLVIGATDDETINRQISRDAESRNTLCNIADRPEVCNFILPSIVQRGDLVITISTSGRSPALAKKLRKNLEKQFGPEYGDLLRLMGAIRDMLLSQAHKPEAHKPLFEKLVNSDLIDLIRDAKTQGINALLLRILGDGYRFEELLPNFSARKTGEE
jgi:precorrin-2 dehydrogenase/sirohydrochlorin ferrochelatase